MADINDILGNERVKEHFIAAVHHKKISHAYIIEGDKGSGKKMLAAVFSKILQCETRQKTEEERACNQCESCIQMENKDHPDVIWVSHEKAGVTSVGEIREQVVNTVDIMPYKGPYKIYIIDEAEKMNVAAQNAILKTIEEPPEYAIIILLTTNADTFLQTILSRCVMLNIRPVKEDIIKNQLTSQYGVGDYEARVAATFSNGNPGKAIKLATSEEFKELKQYVVGMFMSLEKGGMDIIGEAIKKTGTFKKQIDEYFSLMRIWFRDILVYKATKEEDQIIFQDEYMTIEKMSQTYSFDDINDILKAIDLAESRIKSNVNFDSTIEILLLSIKEKTSGK